MMVEMKSNKNREIKLEENSEQNIQSNSGKKPEEEIRNKEDHELRKEMIRGIKFGLFSISAGIIEIISFSLLNELTNWRYWPCYVLALVLSVLWNFTLNRRYTFRSANNVSVAMLKVLGFYVVYVPASTLFGNYLADTLLWNEYLVTLINMLANFILEFMYDRFFVFRTSLDTNHLAKHK
jgi:putative flippase GtrA